MGQSNALAIVALLVTLTYGKERCYCSVFHTEQLQAQTDFLGKIINNSKANLTQSLYVVTKIYKEDVPRCESRDIQQSAVSVLHLTWQRKCNLSLNHRVLSSQAH